MSQEVRTLKLKDLVLWTENPRDPIDKDAKDQDVVNRAIDGQHSKWTLSKLAFEMGDYYDFSELPTVVFHGKRPIVYDGNRRIILGKLKHGYVKHDHFDISNLPNFPSEIPCNVCSEKIALKNVLRKHGESGSWQPLERDMFLHKFMHQEKSIFLVLDENTGLISTHNHLNQRYVKDEIFTNENLNALGFEIKGNKLFSVFSDKEATSILADLSKKVEDKQITTRNNRGKVFDVLDKKHQQLIDESKENEATPAKIDFRKDKKGKKGKAKQKLTKRRLKNDELLFGAKLYLISGDVNELYRGIDDLYGYYLNDKDKLSSSFPGLIRMALRLLCEMAAKEEDLRIDEYVKKYFANAKKELNTDEKTTLSNQNVSDATIVQLLHTGAHNYKSSNNIAQTIAISIILGEMIKITHGKAE